MSTSRVKHSAICGGLAVVLEVEKYMTGNKFRLVILFLDSREATVETARFAFAL